jgi:hypothetical protein
VTPAESQCVSGGLSGMISPFSTWFGTAGNTKLPDSSMARA